MPVSRTMPGRWLGAVVSLLLAAGWVVEASCADGVVDDAVMGRFFTTPRERTLLNFALRRALRKKRQESHQKPERGAVTLNGFVLRSAGPPAVWVDGRSALVEGNGLPDGVDLPVDAREVGRVRVAIPGSDERVALKPGQRMDGMSGSVLESFEVVDMEEGERLKREAEAKRQAEQAAKAKGGGGSRQLDRYNLGAEGAALGEMMDKREGFTRTIKGLTDLLGVGGP